MKKSIFVFVLGMLAGAALLRVALAQNAGAQFRAVNHIGIVVADYQKSLDFYTNVLGFEKGINNPTPGGPRFLTVGVKGQDFVLVLWPGTPGQAQPVQGGIPASVTIETDDIRKTYEELKSRGVKFETEVEEYPWGYVAVFQDPDGNRLQLRQGR